jgi:imidazolonepropionase-like amidohydrolase
MKRIFLKYTRAVVLIAFVLLLAAVFIPFPKMGFPERGNSHLMIENVNIVDLKNDTILQNQSVYIAGGRIRKIRSVPEVANKGAYKSVDGTGKYLIPALWDMHTHLTRLSPQSAHAQFVVHGVMHVRDMRGAYTDRDHFATTPERIREWNRQVNALALLGPLVHDIPSFAVEGPNAMFDGSPEHFNCANSEQAKKLVKHLKAQGVTMIKTYNNLPRGAFFTLLKEAKLAGMEVAGHKPLRVTTIEAANAGMKSLEHARFLLWDSFEGAEAYRKSQDPGRMDNTAFRKQMLDQHDPRLLAANLEALRRNGTYYCPTHLTRKADALAGDKQFRARYDDINPILRFLSFEDLDATLQEDTTQLGKKVYFDIYKMGVAISKTASETGIKILAGSDSPELPGSSLLDELQELSDAGLSKYEVLRTASCYPAEYYHLDKEYGTVEEGKIADLILLNHNPIQNIGNLKKGHSLLYRGIYLNEEEVNGIKQKIHSRNKGLVMSVKLIWDVLMYMTL